MKSTTKNVFFLRRLTTKLETGVSKEGREKWPLSLGEGFICLFLGASIKLSYDSRKETREDMKTLRSELTTELSIMRGNITDLTKEVHFLKGRFDPGPHSPASSPPLSPASIPPSSNSPASSVQCSSINSPISKTQTPVPSAQLHKPKVSKFVFSPEATSPPKNLH